ncbi:MAG: hypothetical protein IJ906_02015 [Oscillospiraceae bacterium]|nr:hypothetical protein [Oscillospiraceae bacterium]
MGKNKYDWLKIDMAYITGDMSLKDLSEEMGIPLRTIETRARKIKYFDRRSEYRKMVLEKVAKRTSSRDAAAVGDLMTATEKAINMIDQYMTDDATLHNYVIGQTETRLDKLDTKALRNMSGALRDVACVIKILYPDNSEPGDDQKGVVLMPDREEEE